MPYNPYSGYIYGGTNMDPGVGFNMELDQLPNDPMDSVPSYSNAGYINTMDRPARANDFESKLQAMLGQVDKEGRFGLSDEDRKTGKNQRWAALGRQLSQAGFSHSYQGYGDAMKNLSPQMRGAEDDYLDSTSNERLKAELTKIDLEDKLTRQEKDKMTLETVQDDFEHKKAARVAGLKAFEASFGPDKREMILAGIQNPAEKKIAEGYLNAQYAYVAAGDWEKAMALGEKAAGMMDEMTKAKLDDLFEQERAQTKGQTQGKVEGSLAAIEPYKGSDGSIKLPSNMIIQNGLPMLKDSNYDAEERRKRDLANAQIRSINSQNDNRIRDDQKAGAAKQRAFEELKKKIRGAFDNVAELQEYGVQRTVDPSTGDKRYVGKDGKDINLYTPDGKLIAKAMEGANEAYGIIEAARIPLDKVTKKNANFDIDAWIKLIYPEYKDL